MITSSGVRKSFRPITTTFFLCEPVFHQANLLARIKAKTGIKQREYLAKKFAFSLTNHIAEFLCSLRVAQTNSLSVKLTLQNFTCLNFLFYLMKRVKYCIMLQ